MTATPTPEPSPGDAAASTENPSLVADLRAALTAVTQEYRTWRETHRNDAQRAKEEGEKDTLRKILPLLDVLADATRNTTNPDIYALATTTTELVATLGLTPYGAAGEPFDPHLHEALSHTPGTGSVTVTIAEVWKPGYYHNGTILRTAYVITTD